MQLEICHTYPDLSEKVADKVLQLLSAYEEPLLCPASGDTPAGLYKVLVNRYQTKQIDPSRWRFIGLDEWVGLGGKDAGSCRYSINKELFQPLHVSENSLYFFDGRATDLSRECELAEKFIIRHTGIRVAILGLGMNGHIAMNEPGSSPNGRTQIVTLHPLTKQVGQKYFDQPQVLTEGITLGLGTLLESDHIVLMVSGQHKAEIVKKMLEQPATNGLPASLLLHHPSVSVFLDADAASLLSNKS